MGRLILIRKIGMENNIHYYAVYKNDSLDEISYYMGLNPLTKKILFYKTLEFTAPDCIYDIELDCFVKEDLALKPQINACPIIKGINAIKNNVFPESISWES